MRSPPLLSGFGEVKVTLPPTFPQGQLGGREKRMDREMQIAIFFLRGPWKSECRILQFFSIVEFDIFWLQLFATSHFNISLSWHNWKK